MQLTKLIKFEPINLTSIIITLLILTVLIVFFNRQVTDFLSRVEKVEAGASGIRLTATPVINPLQHVSSDFESFVEANPSLEIVRKSTFGALEQQFSGIARGEPAVISFAVNSDVRYYSDKGMLKYLSVASEKVKYLALYANQSFVGAIAIEYVISGIATGDADYANFGSKLNNGEWQHFPHLVSRDQVFVTPPTLEALYRRLVATGHAAIPLIENEKLVGFLDYKSISDELYRQAKGSQRV